MARQNENSGRDEAQIQNRQPVVRYVTVGNIAASLRARGGLATSRWAPSNYNYRPQNASFKRAPSFPTTLSSPDRSLPFGTQHCYLTMVQEMMERACYEFALKWVPEAVRENKWTCSQAVELSKWKLFLLAAIPPEALLSTPLQALDNALADAVRIRNMAVHREFCTNEKLVRMTRQAQVLMSIFSDETRYQKLLRLEAELRDWEKKLQSDEEERSRKLQAVLGEISEESGTIGRAVIQGGSAQEVGPRDEERIGYWYDHTDEMDLD